MTKARPQPLTSSKVYLLLHQSHGAKVKQRAIEAGSLEGSKDLPCSVDGILYGKLGCPSVRSDQMVGKPCVMAEPTFAPGVHEQALKAITSGGSNHLAPRGFYYGNHLHPDES